jgi:hypothetical protein
MAFTGVPLRIGANDSNPQASLGKDRQGAPVCKADGIDPMRISRRAAIAFVAAAGTAMATSAPESTSAESMREASVRNRVGQLIEYRDRATGLISRLRSAEEAESLSADEIEFVSRATPVWLRPAIDAIEAIVRSGVDVGDGIDVAGRALKVHLSELAEEARNASRKGCVRELEEYIETLDGVLSKDGLGRFVHGRRWNGKAWVDM